MEAIKDTLDVLLKELASRKEKSAEQSPENLVKKIFSRKEAEHARASFLKNGVLSIKTDSSTWLYYFNLHKKELTEKFSALNPQIKSLKFSLGEFSSGK